jgi:hypothetical protein
VAVTALVDDDVVDDGKWSHGAFPMEVEISIGWAGCPAVAEVTDENLSKIDSNFWCKVAFAFGDSLESFLNKESDEGRFGSVDPFFSIRVRERWNRPFFKLRSSAEASLRRRRQLEFVFPVSMA